MRVTNFCAGPAAIPEPVLEEVRSELLEWGNAGMSIMEMSHRSSIFDEVASNAKQDFIELLNIPDEYDVLFLQGGATHQFSMVPLNFSSQEDSADYLETGAWFKKSNCRRPEILKNKYSCFIRSRQFYACSRFQTLEFRF